MFIVSACLVGLSTRYDGSSSSSPLATEFLMKGEAIPLCPEQLGGLPTPRPGCTLIGGDGFDILRGGAKAVNRNGEDVTQKLISGANEVLRIIRAIGVRRVYLKEGSPSCGVEHTDRGWSKGEGTGVTAALLLGKGVEVIGVP